MYQDRNYLSSSENTGVQELETSPLGDFDGLKTNTQDESPSVAVDPNNAQSVDIWNLSGGQLILCLAIIFLLVTALFWFLYDAEERFTNLRGRLRRWFEKSDNWDQNGTELAEFPVPVGEKVLPILVKSTANLEEDSESTAPQEYTAFPNSERFEAVEVDQNNPHQELPDRLEENHNLTDLPAVLESRNDEIAALKQELAGHATEIETLIKTLGEEKRVALTDAETHYQKLADELAESQLGQSQMQTDLANVTTTLESLTATSDQAEQKMAVAYQELSGKEEIVGQLESQLVSSKSLADSLEKKLRLAQSDLENQLHQTCAAESRTKEIENEALQLMQQLEDQHKEQRNGEAEVESLTAKLKERDDELEKFRIRLDEISASADEKAASLEHSEARYKNLADEFEKQRQIETQTQSELVAAQEEILLLSSKVEQAEKETETVYQKLHKEGDIATGLNEDNKELKSALQQVESQLAPYSGS